MSRNLLFFAHYWCHWYIRTGYEMQTDTKTDIWHVLHHIINIQQIPNCHAISSSLHIIGVTYIRTGYKMPYMSNVIFWISLHFIPSLHSAVCILYRPIFNSKGTRGCSVMSSLNFLFFCSSENTLWAVVMEIIKTPGDLDNLAPWN